MLNKFKVTLQSVTPLGGGAPFTSKRADRETHEDFEVRCYLEKLRVNEAGRCIIPAMALKFCICAAAKHLGRQVPGKGKRTYTKLFESGLLVMDDADLGMTRADAKPIWINANSDGIRGSGKRVARCIPTLTSWKTTVTIAVLDDAIDEKILREHLDHAGMFIGLGQFRAEKGGTNGRFEVAKLERI
jgi:hypothetical protein